MILKGGKKCVQLPEITTIAIFLVLHVLQAAAIVHYHGSDESNYMWGIAIAPLIVLLFWRKYMENTTLKSEQQLKHMLSQLQQQNEPSTRVFNKDTTTTGAHNELIKSNINHSQINEVPRIYADMGNYNPIDNSRLSSSLDPYSKPFSAF